jgi:hypothetical protein
MYHDTVTGDDYGVVTTKYSISPDDFNFLNPMIWKSCTNLRASTSCYIAQLGHMSDYSGYDKSEPSSSVTCDMSVNTSLSYYDSWAEELDAILIAFTKDTCTDR